MTFHSYLTKFSLFVRPLMTSISFPPPSFSILTENPRFKSSLGVYNELMKSCNKCMPRLLFGTTASYVCTAVTTDNTSPSNFPSVIHSWTKTFSLLQGLFLQKELAILAGVPVPQGERVYLPISEDCFTFRNVCVFPFRFI